MPPTYRRPRRLGKQPPEVLPRALAELADTSGGPGWPACLAMPPSGGMECITLVWCYGSAAANADRCGAGQAGGSGSSSAPTSRIQ